MRILVSLVLAVSVLSAAFFGVADYSTQKDAQKAVAQGTPSAAELSLFMERALWCRLDTVLSVLVALFCVLLLIMLRKRSVPQVEPGISPETSARS